MAGAGVRVFQPGEVLTAALVNSYLQDQVVARFATDTARNNAFIGENAPTLEEGRVCYLDSTNELQYYDGDAWVAINSEAVINIITAKGDLAVGTAASTIARLGVGGNDTFLVADSSTATGLKWSTIPADAVTTAKILDSNVTTAKIADSAITSAKIADGAITAGKLAAGAIGIANGSILSAMLEDGAVTQAKLATGTPQAGFRSVQNSATITSSNYTIQLTDLGKLVEIDNATACTLTVPTNASVAFSVGDRIDILQIGAGQVTVTPVSGTVTINGYDGGLKLNGQWAAATLIKRATNTWVAVGNLTT